MSHTDLLLLPRFLIAPLAQALVDGWMATLAGPMAVRSRLALTFLLSAISNSGQGFSRGYELGGVLVQRPHSYG